MEQDREDKIVNRFLVALYENYHMQRTVQFYADLQHLSPYYFSSIIKEKSGKSAMQWIENVTMTFMRQHIEDSDMSLKQIAELPIFPTSPHLADISSNEKVARHRNTETKIAYALSNHYSLA